LRGCFNSQAFSFSAILRESSVSSASGFFLKPRCNPVSIQ
jgi:hypothetical protein